jgi:hypothetical protein
MVYVPNNQTRMFNILDRNFDFFVVPPTSPPTKIKSSKNSGKSVNITL